LKKKLYLCGTITSDQECQQWRNDTIAALDGHPTIEVVDPLRGKNFYSIKGLGFESETPGWWFVTRDVEDVKNSDLLICYLKYLPQRQSIGTFMELGIAVAYSIPFIVISEHEEVLRHPFISELAAQIVPTLDEAIAAARFILM
jgi:nucleoside 2-deoxyribosyltransferase